MRSVTWNRPLFMLSRACRHRLGLTVSGACLVREEGVVLQAVDHAALPRCGTRPWAACRRSRARASSKSCPVAERQRAQHRTIVRAGGGRGVLADLFCVWGLGGHGVPPVELFRHSCRRRSAGPGRVEHSVRPDAGIGKSRWGLRPPRSLPALGLVSRAGPQQGGAAVLRQAQDEIGGRSERCSKPAETRLKLGSKRPPFQRPRVRLN